MRKYERSQRGFALVEIIIAIGVLAVVSMFILEMFVRAANMSQRARDKDNACFEAQTVLALYRALPVQGRAALSVSGRDATRSAPGVWTFYYDDAWRPVAAPPDAGFTLTLTAAPGTNAETLTAGAWETLSVTVVKNEPYLLEKQPRGPILTLTTGLYRPRGETAR
ncbi:MAG: prepilin-type N-terminal cleavage/methylation domain-containing protein [Oscillospiraceae bacterium]|jgi:prepilin-type N-terminal cleavage/methylation domain-containing protein|nr:prepilin-type N-terminal cleavage/methylation domain-containing protein [Oscillospiraceae bacterium]